jgi:hypothetical protein
MDAGTSTKLRWFITDSFDPFFGVLLKYEAVTSTACP